VRKHKLPTKLSQSPVFCLLPSSSPLSLSLSLSPGWSPWLASRFELNHHTNCSCSSANGSLLLELSCFSLRFHDRLRNQPNPPQPNPILLHMHPFCCVSPVSDRTASAFAPMPPPPHQPAEAAAARAFHANGHDYAPLKHLRVRENGGNQNQNPNLSQHNQMMTAVDQREVKINDLVGNGICGVLYKWVNYGKGWRPRWFVLQDGVLSYYKIHGPDKITLGSESEKGSKVIGDESMRRINRHKNSNSPPQLHRKPFGEIHLKVCLSLCLILCY